VDGPIELGYLLLAPLGSATAGAAHAPPSPRDAPDFFAVDIDVHSAGSFTVEAGDVHADVRCQVFDGRVWVAECRYRLDDPLSESGADRKRAVEAALRADLLSRCDTPDIWEQYSLVLVPTPPDGPDAFLERSAVPLARLLRSLPKRPDELQVEEILRERALYSEQDMTIVDWLGAAIIAENALYQSDVDLCLIGKYQLLRYRLLDQAIEQHLREVRAHLAEGRARWRPATQRVLGSVVDGRLELLLEFERTAQSLLFVGEWYSARVYWLLVQNLYLDDWKRLVSDKLASLEAIDATVRESLTLSWRRLLDIVSLAGWTFLLIGYFVLFFLNNG
jgi:hypothetical protein